MQMIASITICHPGSTIFCRFQNKILNRTLGCSWNKGSQVHHESWIDLPFCVNKTWKTIKHFKARFLKVKKALIEI